MKIVKFTIRNFRGIGHTTIALADEVPGNVITLIGLNESGKTTVLEALSQFVTEDKETASLVGTVQQRSSVQDLIPKHQKAAFTGRISIEATILLDEADIIDLSTYFMDTHKLILNPDKIKRRFTVDRGFEFEDTANTTNQVLWSLIFPLKTKRATNYTIYSSKEPTRAIWLAALAFLREHMPRVVYFPTFLFNFPDRIYLEGDKLPEVNEYYKKAIQDILDSLGGNLNIQKHIIDRVKKHREHPGISIASFVGHFRRQDEYSQIDAVIQNISNEMSRVIFGAWSDILGRNVENKRIQVEWAVDPFSLHDKSALA